MVLLLVFMTVVCLGVILKIYIKLQIRWCKSQTCLVGKTAIVTGANTGVGYQTALDFAKRGARVILACRNRQKAEDARLTIIEETGNKNIIVKLIDMALFDSVRAFAKEIKEEEERLDILVNNAGIAEMRNIRSEDGHLLIMQVNYFSSFLLTNLLLELMVKTKKGRIINVASSTAKLAFGFNVDKLDRVVCQYSTYVFTKLCNILFTIELAKRLEGTGITTYSVHPGVTDTAIFDYVKGPLALWALLFRKLFFKTVEEGAQTLIYCSVTKGIEQYNGEHFDCCRKVARYWTAGNVALPRKLWEATEKIVGLKSEHYPKLE